MKTDNHIRYAIGVDVGGTKVEAALVDSNGRVIQRSRFPTDVRRGPQAIEQNIVDVINELQKISNSPIEGIGIGIAGQIEYSTGSVLFAPNLHWHNVRLQSDLSRSLGRFVTVLNDVRAAAWGEWRYGAGQGCDDLICLFVGTGVGGGVVCNGQMLNGASNSAGELGHTIINFDGPLCHCGNHGCLETYAGGWAIARSARDAAIAHRAAAAALLQHGDGDVNQIDAKAVIDTAKTGDPFSREIMDLAVKALGAGCMSFIHAFNPGRLILGGGIMEGDPELIVRINSAVRSNALHAATASLQILPSQLHLDAGVIGAAAAVFSSIDKSGVSS